MGQTQLKMLGLMFPQRYGQVATREQEKVSETGTPSAPTGKHWLTGSLGSWKGTLFLGSLSCCVVLLINVGFIAWAASGQPVEDRLSLYAGDCDKVKQMSVGIHLVINVLSTVLLAASNFGMQCLCAPTRACVDRAHKSNLWLDIGAPSFRNLGNIPRLQLLLWCCLGLSSLPLHLFYNSTVFSTVAANAYNVYIGNSSIAALTNTTDIRMWSMDSRPGPVPMQDSFARLVEKSANGALERLEPAYCLAAYATNYQSAYGSVMLISDGSSLNLSDYDVLQLHNQTVVKNAGWDPYLWICEDIAPKESCSTHLGDISAHADDWRVLGGHHVDYCLVESFSQTCRLECSFPLSMTIIITNLIKALIIALAAYYLRDHPLLTTGDAVASFIKRPDETSKGMSLLAKATLHSAGEAMEYNRTPKRWGTAVSPRRWWLCISSHMAAFGICAGLLGWGLAKMQLNGDIQSWKIGLGAIDPKTFITGTTWPSDLVIVAIVANVPQVVFSILYLLVNSVWTTMALAAEWNSYSLTRKGLRVSTTPRGAQRTTYFLSLPYRFAFPLMACSAVLHWLISQSLYLVSVEGYDNERVRDPYSDVVTCAYSPLGIVCSLAVGFFMVVCLGGAGGVKFGSGMPVASSCSYAISAACHAREVSRREAERDDVFRQGFEGLEDVSDGLREGSGQEEEGELGEEYRPLMWGVVPPPEPFARSRCAFSSESIETPVHGTVYQ